MSAVHREEPDPVEQEARLIQFKVSRELKEYERDLADRAVHLVLKILLWVAIAVGIGLTVQILS